MYDVSIFFFSKRSTEIRADAGSAEQARSEGHLVFHCFINGNKNGKLTYARKNVQSRDELVGYTYVEGDKKMRGTGRCGLNGSVI